jgi:hypothetical protein
MINALSRAGLPWYIDVILSIFFFAFGGACIGLAIYHLTKRK